MPETIAGDHLAEFLNRLKFDNLPIIFVSHGKEIYHLMVK